MERFDDERTTAAACVVVLGSANIDSYVYLDRFPQPGETVFGTAGRRGLGGKGANQAVAAALIGAATSFLGQVGADDGGAFVRDTLAGYGVDTSGLRVSPTAVTGSAQITVDAAGENTIVVVSGANAEAGPDILGPESAALDVPAGSIGLAQGELPAEAVAAFARALAARGLRFILNLAPVIDIAPDALRLADPLIVNESEALALLARDGDPRSFGTADALDAARRLAGTVAESVVITLGADGAVAATGDRQWHQPAPVPAVVVDTTGAGDAFVGALAAALAGGADLETAVGRGAAAGSAAVAALGTVDSYDALRALAQDGVVVP
ncbi:ribokinase [Leifsonia shinshuensis]|uniref:ribokinase n=1 Tax=Leifsonia shinshuensis TaxID=150026 RepID=UPI00162949E2|nr:ribokinase [Leifsonia shinshuensis]